MKKIGFLIIIISMLIGGVANAQSISQRLKGRILLQVEDNGEAWYVEPNTRQRYFLNRPLDAFGIMRSLGVGITDSDLLKIPVALDHTVNKDSDGDGLSDSMEDALGTDKTKSDTDGDGYSDYDEILNGYSPTSGDKINYDLSFSNSQKGKIFIQVQKHGEAWYVSPVNGKRYFLGRPSDAFAIMRKLGLGISNNDLKGISIAKESVSTNTAKTVNKPKETTKNIQGIIYEDKVVKNSRGEFEVLVAKIPINEYKMVSLTGQTDNCFGNCAAKPLEDYVKAFGAVVGIHGSYFCPPDYSQCNGKTYSYEMPFFNSSSNVMVNEYKMPFHEGPMIVYNNLGKYELYHRPLEIGWKATEYQSKFGKIIKAAVSNYPSLIENGVIVVNSEPTLSTALRDNKSPRGGIGFDDKYVYVLVAKKATVIDFAYIMQTIGVKNGINLDGGGTTAMYVDNEYVIGPGRLLPNAIVFVKK